MLYQFSRHFFAILIIPVCLILVSAVTACSGTPTSTLSEGTPGDHTPSTATPSPSGAASCEQPTTETPAAPPEPSPTPQPPTTAVLFLIDESGGVSGRCTQLLEEEGEHLVVDEEGIRYKVIKFVLTTMGIYQKERPSEKPLYVGVAQFADMYEPVLELTSVASLLDGDEWRGAFSKLSPESDLPSSLDPCHTDFAKAIQDATQALTETVAKKRALVLITDGSFVGWPHQEDPITAAKSVLEEAANNGIEVYVMLLGEHECRNDCPNMDDLKEWRAWASAPLGGQSLVNRLDVQEPFRALSAIREMKPFWPANAQWVDAEGKGEFVFYDYTYQERTWVVYEHPEQAEDPQVFDSRGIQYNLSRPIEWPEIKGAYRYSRLYPAYPNPDFCSWRTWSVQVPPGAEALYWTTEELPQYQLAELTASPVLLSAFVTSSLSVDVKVEGSGVTPDGFEKMGNCYQLKLSLLDDDGHLVDEKSTPLSVSPIRSQFELAPDTPPQTLTVQAQIWPVYGEDASQPLDEGSIAVTATYKPELGQVSIVFSSDDELQKGDVVTVTVPITYGLDRYTPGVFLPAFYLECSEPEEDAYNCFDSRSRAPWKYASFEKRGNVGIYKYVLPWEKVWRPGCKCRCARITWRGFQAHCDLSSVECDVLPVSNCGQ